MFVSYNSRDYDWVQDKLLPLLEEHGVTYCIHSRDFEVGRPVLENMIDSVYRSKQMVAVLSKNYMSSSFCKEELSIASFKSENAREQSLIGIRIDDITKAKLPKDFRKKTFLDYNDREEQKVWDKRLIKHLKLKSPASV